MNSKSLLAIAFLGLTALACNNAEESTSEETTTPTEEKTFVNEQGVVQLNNGQRWQANAETTAGISKMLDQIGQFKALGLPEEITNYNMLGGGLNTTLKGIFDLCTMTGAAHEELHDYLLPIAGYIKALKGTDIVAAQTAKEDLEKYLASYRNFFE